MYSVCSWLGPYVRELGEVCSVKVQLLRQMLHEVRALLIGERAEGETHRGAGRHILEVHTN